MLCCVKWQSGSLNNGGFRPHFRCFCCANTFVIFCHRCTTYSVLLYIAAHSKETAWAGVNLKTGDNASKFKPVPFLQRHWGGIGINDRLLLLTYWTHICVHTISLGLCDANTAAVEPVVTTVTANVESNKHYVHCMSKSTSSVLYPSLYTV